MDLGVGPAEPPVVSLADDPAVTNEHAANHRVGFDPPLTTPCQGHGAAHHSHVELARRWLACGPA